ncbi:MAG TPA: CBS domain-containing protein [Candidatus Binatia bacterium]|nr:CBS domain-containing protein [Candidatus Binatia bacterium]
MVAKDIMTKKVITVDAETPVQELAQRLLQKAVSGVPVVDNGGKILGVVSEADLLAKKGRLARDIMSEKIFSVGEDASVEDIAALMTAEKIKRVLVVGEKELAGIVSRADIVRAIALGDYAPLRTPVYDL